MEQTITYDEQQLMAIYNGGTREPACGVGNFFGCLPDSMAASKLYGVELDPITGRIAKQLYPQADITVAGFETTDRRNFYDLAIGNVPFGQYQVNDPAYNKYKRLEETPWLVRNMVISVFQVKNRTLIDSLFPCGSSALRMKTL